MMQVFHNGVFLSCEEENRTFSVLVEDKGKIVYTGDSVPAPYQGAPQVDLGGACVVPAFADTHMHFESYALFQSTADVRDCKDFSEMKQVLQQYLVQNPGTKFFPAYGCSAHTVAEGRLPQRADLDEMVSIPLLIVKYDGHAAVANSALIQQFPPEVTQDPGFSPETGWLYQNAFYKGVNFITQKISPFKILSGMDQAACQLAQRGIGYVHTVEGVGYKNDIDVDTMRFAHHGFPNQFRIFFQTMDVPACQKHKLRRIGGCFRLALDGCFGSEDAALSQGYTNNPSNKGFLAYTQQEVNDFCIQANRAGMQIAMHAIGDAAVDQALTAYEAALQDTPRTDHRHIIIHADLIPEEMQRRAARLGLTIALQPAFLDWKQEPGDYLTHILGERAQQILPLRSMLDQGILLTAGSDAPCTIPDPIQSIHLCCNHPNPAQRITPLEALKMHTLWAAKSGFDEDLYGSLTEGKFCNFVVLDQNPLTVDPAKLNTIQIKGTWLKGTEQRAGAAPSLAKLLCKLARAWMFCKADEKDPLTV